MLESVQIERRSSLLACLAPLGERASTTREHTGVCHDHPGTAPMFYRRLCSTVPRPNREPIEF